MLWETVFDPGGTLLYLSRVTVSSSTTSSGALSGVSGAGLGTGLGAGSLLSSLLSKSTGQTQQVSCTYLPCPFQGTRDCSLTKWPLGPSSPHNNHLACMSNQSLKYSLRFLWKKPGFQCHTLYKQFFNCLISFTWSFLLMTYLLI